MILMWLGSWVVALFALVEFRKAWSQWTASAVTGLLEAPTNESNFKMFFRLGALAALQSASENSLYGGQALFNLRIWKQKASVLWMCLSPLSYWSALLLASLYLNFNGFLLLGIGFFSFIAGIHGRPPARLLRCLFFAGLFLVGGELALKNSSVLINSLGISELTFFLADGRWPAVLGLMALGLLVSFVLRIEAWSLILALSLMTANILSVNGAIGLFAGERVAQVLLFWWRSRSLNQDCQRVATHLTAVSLSSVFLGVMLSAIVRGSSAVGFASDMDLYRQKIVLLLFMVMVVLGAQLLAQMVWGHFGSRLKTQEMQTPAYVPRGWIEAGLLAAPVLTWARTQVQKRLSEIRYHLQGLSSVKEGQIPQVLQARLKEEEKQLSEFLLG